MSGASVISQGYETASELSLSLSRAVRDVKAEHLHVQVAPSDLAASAQTLRSIVFSLERLLYPTRRPSTSAVAAVDLPAGLDTWLRATHQGDAVTAPVLARVRSHLEHEPPLLDAEDIAVLERIERVVDAHAHHLFLQMSRTTGAR